MFKINDTSLWGFENAVLQMHHKDSTRSDSTFHNKVVDSDTIPDVVEGAHLGDKDLRMLKDAYHNANGSPDWANRINVTMNISAPTYWWLEFQQYCPPIYAFTPDLKSLLKARKFSLSDFQIANYETAGYSMCRIVKTLNRYRSMWLKDPTDDNLKMIWSSLPMNYIMQKPVVMSYQDVFRFLRTKRNDSSMEWRLLCHELRNLPYVQEIME